MQESGLERKDGHNERMANSPKALTVIAAILVMANLGSCQWFDDGNELNSQGMKALTAGKYEKAEQYFARAITTLDRQIGQNRQASTPPANLVRQLAYAYGNLGKSQKERGRYSDATNSYAKAIDLLDEGLPRTEEFLLHCTHELSLLLFNQRKLVDAEQLCRQELVLAKQLYGAHSVRGAIAANNLARISETDGKNEEAEQNYRLALEMCEGAGGKEADRQTIDILNNFAVFYEKIGYYADAKELVERSLKLQKPSSAGYIADRVKSLFVLALINKDTYEFESAEHNYDQALRLIENSPEHRELLCEGLDHYADLLQAQHKFEKAEPVYERCVAVCEKVHGKDHPNVAERLSDFAVLYRREGRLAEAKTTLKRALSIQENSVGVDSLIYLETVNRLTAVLKELGEYQEADQLYASVVQRLRKKVGPDHPYLADMLDNQAMFVEKLRGKRAADKLRATAKLIRVRLAGSLQQPARSAPPLP